MIRINLIPSEERIVTTTAGPNWAVIALAVAPVVYAMLLGSVYMYQVHTMTELDEKIREEEAALNHYKPAVAKLETMRKEHDDIQARLESIEQIDRDRQIPVRLIEAVSRSVPRYLWLDRIEETGAPGVEVAIQGKTFSNLIVSDFLDRLGGSRFFTVPELTITEEQKIGKTRVVEFKLVARGDRDGPYEEEEIRTALAVTDDGTIDGY